MMELSMKIILSLVLLNAMVLAETEEEYHEWVQSSLDTLLLEYPGFWEDPFVTERDFSSHGINFNCPISDQRPAPATSVNELTPYDIKVVGAMGDSITAAFFAKFNLFDILAEYRGISWSIGGDYTLDRVVTLPNVIKMFNPDVTGFSVGKGNKNSENARLNVAVSASIAQSLPEQAKILVEKIEANPDINIENDWKLVTLWIGGNNLCWSCINDNKHTVYNYVGSIIEALNYLEQHLPRTFVNLVLNIDVTKLSVLSENSFCDFLNSIECPCRNSYYTKELSALYQEALYHEIYDVDRYNNKEDFTVVIQPFFLDIEVPLENDGSPDFSYFALDCFHFSPKSHEEAAVALWNNMVEPVGFKSTSWVLNGPLLCPSVYFYTRKNSPGHYTRDHTSGNLLQGKNTPTNTKDDSSHVIAIATGSSIGVLLVLVVVLVVGGVWIHRKKSNRNNSENDLLLK